MTKFVKMSLAAAVAVAGISTTASAMDNTSYSGKLYVEQIASTSGSNASTVNSWDIDIDVTAKTKITDTLSSVVTVQADGGSSDQVGTYATGVNVDSLYFQYANAGAAVMWGAQDINTPNTDGEDGDGIMATYTAGSITAAAAYFPNNGVSTGNDVSAVAVLGSAGPVNFEAWNVNIAGKGAAGSSNTTLVVGGDFGPVSAEVRSATTSYNATGTKDGSTMKLSVSGKASSVGITGIYFSTDKDGAALVTDPSSSNSIELVNLAHSNSFYDTTLMALIVSAPVSEMGSVSVSYGTGDLSTTQSVAAATDVSELVLQYNHKIAKSTKMSVRYADYTQETAGVSTDKTHARVDLKYSF